MDPLTLLRRGYYRLFTFPSPFNPLSFEPQYEDSEEASDSKDGDYIIEPLNGRELCPKSPSTITITSPKHHTQVGRPKKKRKRDAEELSQPIANSSKLLRHGKIVTCAKCNKQRHNSRTCKGQEYRA